MKRLISHNAVRTVVLSLIFLSALGYTTVIPFCTMSQSTDCCCAHNHHAQPTEPATGTSVGSAGMSCDVQIVAGGLTPVAPNTTSEARVNPLAPGVDVDQRPAVCPPWHATGTLSLLAVDVRPPDLALFLRNAVLLI